jgi:hypothetical protein
MDIVLAGDKSSIWTTSMSSLVGRMTAKWVWIVVEDGREKTSNVTLAFSKEERLAHCIEVSIMQA